MSVSQAIIEDENDKQTGDLLIPNHIAIIMDGNGRWANAKGLPRKLGHKAGGETLEKTIEACIKQGVKFLTVYAFSSENWNRPEDEVNDLMDLMRYYLRQKIKSLNENNIRLNFIGDHSRLSDDIQQELVQAKELTKRNSALTLTVALSYGSRQEIIRTIKSMAVEIASGKTTPEQVDEYTVLAHLDTNAIPDPDLLIRTGGEKRLSNFLLWQSAYAELYFSDVLWPDFTEQNLQQAIEDFSGRERRFGSR
ncbi:MAG: isoprenyl transferase [Rickettsiales bacterium]|nr:isoprenyl transferase [Rickettsiales bacterium]